MTNTTTSASKGLRNTCFAVTAVCISASMFHLYMAFSGMFEGGAFLYGMIATFAAVLVGSQLIFALTTQAIKGRMDWWVIVIGVLAIGFTEGVVSVPTSQFAINVNMIQGTASQSESSQEAKEIRKAIARSERRIEGLDNTLLSAKAENMTNRAVVSESIEAEERKIRQFRGELKRLDESSADIAFSEMMWGLSRNGLANVMSASLTIVPACMSIMLGAMAFGGKRQKLGKPKSAAAKGASQMPGKTKASILKAVQ